MSSTLLPHALAGAVDTQDVSIRELGAVWFGESPLPEAPVVALEKTSTPQQFIDYQHDKTTLEAIVSCCAYDERYPIFVGADDGLYLQVGIIGADNFKHKDTAKIVYGRRWLVERSTPTSEVIQTCFLALQKAREHELREFVVMTSETSCHTGSEIGSETNSTSVTTPFNSHHDLPLMAENAALFTSQTTPLASIDSVNAALAAIRIGGITIEATELVTLNRHLIMELSLRGTCSEFPELENTTIVVNSASFDQAHLFHETFAALLKKVNDTVAEQFTFLGFARFSHSIHPDQIAAFSKATRKLSSDSKAFAVAFAEMAQRVDSQHAPQRSTAALINRDEKIFAEQTGLSGYMPR